MNKMIKNTFKNKFLTRLLAGAGLLALPVVALAFVSFNSASTGELPTIQVLNATQNPNSTTAWTTSISARGGDVVSVQIYYHNSGTDAAQNTILRLNVPTTSGNSIQVSGGVSASNGGSANGSATVNFTDGQPHTLTYAGTMRWYPDQLGSSRPPLNGQSGIEVFNQGFYVGTVPVDNGSAAPGQAWNFSQGTLNIDFHVSPAVQQSVCPASAQTNQPSGITQTSANFSGSFNPNPSGAYQTWFDYGTTQSFGQQTFQQSGSTSFFGSASNLQQGTTYFVRSSVRSTDPACNGVTIFGNTVQFQTTSNPAALSATTNQASSVTQTSAMLNGVATGSNVTNVTRWFEYGTTFSLGQQTQQQFGQGQFSDNIFSLQPNTTYFYRTVGRSNETGAVFGQILQFQTLGNPAVCPLNVITNQPTGITLNSANFSGNVNPTPSGSFSNWFEYGTTQNFGQTTFQQSGSGASFSGSAFSLQPGTTYFLRAAVRSNDFNCANQQTVFGNTVQFQTGSNPAALSATTNPATGMTQNSAMLNGSVTGSNVTNVTRWFEYGTTFSLGQQTQQQFGQGTYSDNIFSLQPNTTYFFRAAGRSNETSTVFGQILTFQTLGNPAVCPSNVTTNQPTNITLNSASFSGTVSPTPGGSYSNWFEYGTTQSFGQQTSQQSGNGATFNGSAFSLQAGTTYFLRAAVRSTDFNCTNQQTIFGNTVQFQTTSNPAALSATTNQASSVTQTSAMLNGVATGSNVTNVTRWFEYGTTFSLGQQTQQQFGQGAYSDNIFSLTANTTYFYRAAARSNETGTVFGQILTFQTLPIAAVCPASVITNQPTNITLTSANFSGNVNPTPGGSFSNWFEYGTTQSFGQSTSQQVGSGATFSGSAFSLQAGTTYFLRAAVRSTDFNCNGSTIFGNTVQFTTTNNPASLSATTNQATNISQTSATLNGVATGSNVTNVTRWFEYGTTFGLGQQTSVQSGQGNYSDGIFSLTANTTYYYRASARSNETGTVNGQILTFQTLPIAATWPASVITNQPTNISLNSANLSATVNPVPSGSFTNWFDYGTTNAFGQQTSQQSGTGASFTGFLNNLQPATTYFVRASVRSLDSTCSQVNIPGNTVQFQTTSNPASLSATTNQASSITQNSAMLNGIATGSNVTNVTRWFEYGTTFSSLNQQTSQQSGQGSYTDSIFNLAPNTTYYYHAAARSTETGTVYGQTLSFQTTGNLATCPSNVTTLYPSGITQNSASYSGTVNQTTGSYTSWFEYGTTPSYGQQTSNQTSFGTSFSGFASNLNPNTTYYVRAAVRSTDTGCSQVTVYGNPLTFQTLGQVIVQQPATLSVTTTSATNVTQNNATLNGYTYGTNANNITHWFEYGTTYSLGQRTADQFGQGNFSDSAFNLQPATTYYYRASARSNETGIVYGSILTFQTPAQYIPPYVPPYVPPYIPPVVNPQVITNPATSITTSSARMNASAIMNGVQSNGWFEYGTTPALGQTTLQLNLGATNANTYYTIATGLAPRTLYYFRAVTSNVQGSQARGQILTFTTLAPAVVYVPPVVTYIPPKPIVKVAAVTYPQVKSGEVITKTVENLSFPCGTTTVYVCAREGHTVQYTIKVINPSWTATSNAVVTDTLSPFLDFKSASEDASYNAGTRVVQWSRSLGPREGHTYTIQVLARDIANNVTVKNSAQIFVGGKTYTSNTTEVCITLNPVRIDITADKATVAPGDTIAYTIRYTGVSDSLVQNLILHVPVPQGTVLAGADRPNLQVQGGNIVIPIGTLNPKQSGSITMNFKVDPKVIQDEPIVFAVTASFQDNLGNAQPEEQFYVFTPITKSSTPLNAASVVGSTSTSTGGFLPTSILGWLAFLLLLLIVALIIMRLVTDYRGGKGRPPETV